MIGIDRRKLDGKPEDIVHYQMDLRRRKTRDIFRAGGVRAVVHLGVMHDPRESDRTHHEWNVVGFQKLLDYLSLYRVSKLVVLSSATLYGPRPDNPQFLSEQAPLLGAQSSTSSCATMRASRTSRAASATRQLNGETGGVRWKLAKAPRAFAVTHACRHFATGRVR